MQFYYHANEQKYPVCILIKKTAFNTRELDVLYTNYLQAEGVDPKSILFVSLEYNKENKAPASLIDQQLVKLSELLQEFKVSSCLVADTNYFKKIVKVTNTKGFHGTAVAGKYPGTEEISFFLSPNHKSFVHNQTNETKHFEILDVFAKHSLGNYIKPGSDIIHSACYVTNPNLVYAELKKYINEPILFMDIETFDLDFHKAGIATFGVAKNQHEGSVVAVDYAPLEHSNKWYGYCQPNRVARNAIKKFLQEYKGEVVWHGGNYDHKVLIYNLWMKNPNDYGNALKGLNCLTKSYQDTKIIAYLALNSTARTPYNLKDLAEPFAGHYAVDVKDVRKVPLPDLMKYNLIDCLSTAYVYNKYKPIMIQDEQEDIYKTLMMPSQKYLTLTELNGMAICPKRLKEVKKELIRLKFVAEKAIQDFPAVKKATETIQKNKLKVINAALKTKQHGMEKVADIQFNPNSGNQVAELLYTTLGLPVLGTTDKGNPSTDAKTFAKLKNHVTDPEIKELLDHLNDYTKVEKILSTFIAAFERGRRKNGLIWINGNFNIGGTVSGRLSSSEPNLQNLPSGSTYGKLVKSCFVAPEGFVFSGADFNSLEDYISALTTRDPNKLNVYLKGFDGHSLRAAYYFRDQLSHIDIDDPKSVNSIKKTHEHLRTDSKAPTFALTYQGTWNTLVNNCGFSPEKAKSIEENYHELYKVSDQWVENRLKQASKDGYAVLAFGLRIRTPLLSKVVYGASAMPYQASAEGRTVGNALGQSWGLLNNRAFVAFMDRLMDSSHKEDIRPAALIHDAMYFYVKNDIKTIKWLNDVLVEEMQWQEDPLIADDQVKLGAELDIYYPSWKDPITLKNNLTQEEIIATIDKELEQRNETTSN